MASGGGIRQGGHGHTREGHARHGERGCGAVLCCCFLRLETQRSDEINEKLRLGSTVVNRNAQCHGLCAHRITRCDVTQSLASASPACLPAPRPPPGTSLFKKISRSKAPPTTPPPVLYEPCPAYECNLLLPKPISALHTVHVTPTLERQLDAHADDDDELAHTPPPHAAAPRRRPTPPHTAAPAHITTPSRRSRQ